MSSCSKIFCPKENVNNDIFLDFHIPYSVGEANRNKSNFREVPVITGLYHGYLPE